MPHKIWKWYGQETIKDFWFVQQVVYTHAVHTCDIVDSCDFENHIWLQSKLLSQFIMTIFYIDKSLHSHIGY